MLSDLDAASLQVSAYFCVKSMGKSHIRSVEPDVELADVELMM